MYKRQLERYPAVEISLTTGLSRRISQMLQKEEIAIAVIRGDYRWSEEKFLLSEEPICLVSSQPIELSDLPYKPHISYLTDSSLENMVREWWSESFSRPPLITMEVDGMDICRQMVLHGLGWAILPTIGLKKHDGLYTQELTWRNGDALLRRTWLMYPAASLELSAVNAFVDFLRSRKE